MIASKTFPRPANRAHFILQAGFGQGSVSPIAQYGSLLKGPVICIALQRVSLLSTDHVDKVVSIPFKVTLSDAWVRVFPGMTKK
jgi:hypothetical protein